MLDTVRGNLCLLMAEDNFSRYCRKYPIPNKEARTVAKVLIDQHVNIYGLPDQLHYAMFGQEAMQCGLDVSYTLCGEENNVPLDRRHAGRKTMCLQEHERCARRKSKAECPDVQTFNPEHPSRLSGMVFRS